MDSVLAEGGVKPKLALDKELAIALKESSDEVRHLGEELESNLGCYGEQNDLAISNFNKSKELILEKINKTNDKPIVFGDLVLTKILLIKHSVSIEKNTAEFTIQVVPNKSINRDKAIVSNNIKDAPVKNNGHDNCLICFRKVKKTKARLAIKIVKQANK